VANFARVWWIAPPLIKTRRVVTAVLERTRARASPLIFKRPVFRLAGAGGFVVAGKPDRRRVCF